MQNRRYLKQKPKLNFNEPPKVLKSDNGTHASYTVSAKNRAGIRAIKLLNETLAK